VAVWILVFPVWWQALAFARYQHPEILQPAVSRVALEEFGRKNTDYGEQVDWLNTHLPIDARIYTMLNQNYYARHNYVAMHALSEYGGFLLTSSADDYYRRLRRVGIAYVAYHRWTADETVEGELLNVFLKRLSEYAEILRADGRLRSVAVLGRGASAIDVCRLIDQTPRTLALGVDALEVEAEDFVRGDARVSFDLAPRVGIVRSQRRQASVSIEYDLDIRATGRYELRLRFAAEDPRPVSAFVDGRPLGQVALDATGSWGPESLRWDDPLPLELTSGLHVLRLQREGPFPHIDRLRIARVSQRPSLATSSVGPAPRVTE
jgi:hypothetical protein